MLVLVLELLSRWMEHQHAQETMRLEWRQDLKEIGSLVDNEIPNQSQHTGLAVGVALCLPASPHFATSI